MKYKELADKYSVSLNTIKSWVKRYNWSEEKKQKGAHKNKKGAPLNNKSKNNNKESMQQEVKEVLNNSKLTDKQRLFCIYYIKYFNATKAYQKAYECDYITANTNGPRLLVNACIKQEIQRLKEGRLNRAMLEPEDIFQKFMDIAFADISDYVTFGRKEIEVDKDEEGNPVMIEVNYVDFKNSNEVDGTLISEVSQGKNGVSVKLQDRMKAMNWLADHMDLATEEQKARIEKLKADIAKTGENNNTNDGVLKEMLEGLKDGL
ncbi:phage portal protein [Clostridiaceae bacterium 14S0207]|nr:phage portal protein [Clostridiaceae bacterium 14S0207]